MEAMLEYLAELLLIEVAITSIVVIPYLLITVIKDLKG